MTHWLRKIHYRLARLISDRCALVVMLRRSGSSRGAALIVLSIGRGIAPNVVIIAIGALVGSIPDAVSHGLSSGPGHRAELAMAVVGVVLLADAFFESILSYLGATMGHDYVLAASESLALASMSPQSTWHLDDPEIRSEISALNPRIDRTGLYWGLPNMLAELVTARVAGIGSAAILITFHWWAPVVLAVGWIILNVGFREWARRLQLGFAEGRRGALRWAGYLRGIAIEPQFAKELRIFGLATWAIQRFSNAWNETMASLWKDRRMGSRAVLLGTGAVFVCHAAVLTKLGLDANRHALSASQLTVYAQAVMGVASLGVVGTPELQVVRASTNASKLLALERRLAAFSEPGHIRSKRAAQRDLTNAPEEEVRLENLQFSYPRQSRPVLDGLDLVIPAGQSLAIVGENGAGKSTLIRLLSGIETPQRGRIMVDSIDLRDVTPESWWKQLGVVYQDFVRYQLPLQENVGFGRICLSDDVAEMGDALNRAGRPNLPDLLPNGWETVLSPTFGGGVDLSGGQWQQVALARAFLAIAGGARFLILDEPTASLDPKAEIEMFRRFLRKTAGLTTILVTHRLASVRNVDRIVVLDKGRIVEDGSHEELISGHGLYSSMFQLQAERFNLDRE